MQEAVYTSYVHSTPTIPVNNNSYENLAPIKDEAQNTNKDQSKINILGYSETDLNVFMEQLKVRGYLLENMLETAYNLINGYVCSYDVICLMEYFENNDRLPEEFGELRNMDDLRRILYLVRMGKLPKSERRSEETEVVNLNNYEFPNKGVINIMD